MGNRFRFFFAMEQRKPLETVQRITSVDLYHRAEATVLMRSLRVIQGVARLELARPGMSELILPIACTLSDSELRERRETVLQKIRSAVSDVKEIENGFAYQFASGAEVIMELAHLIDLEHQCCPFLQFRLTVEPGVGPIRLELTGPAGTKDFLSEVFN